MDQIHLLPIFLSFGNFMAINESFFQLYLNYNAEAYVQNYLVFYLFSLSHH